MSATWLFACASDPAEAPDSDPVSCAATGTCQCDDTHSCEGMAVCDQGVCQPTCVAGTPDCGCDANQQCGDGLICDDGTCLVDDCEGALGCACDADGCDDGLACSDGQCASEGCPVGAEGCVCGVGNTCDGGLQCAGRTCEEPATACVPGAVGCQCDDNAGCQGGLVCHNAVCVTTGLANRVPTSPACYTPCHSDAVDDDGVVHACDSDGLIAGCLGDTTCLDGQCLATDETAGACASALECPLHQDCVMGRCLSNCDGDSDCLDGAICHRRACRVACTTTDAHCASNEYCSTANGEHGVCLPNAAAGIDELADLTPFTVEPPALHLTANRIGGQFTLTNESARDLTFTLVRRDHTLWREDGTAHEVILEPGMACELTDCPLYWLDWGVEDLDGEVLLATEGSTEIAIPLVPGESVVVAIEDAGAVDVPRWSGAIDVLHPEGAVQTVNLSHSSAPDGQWAGELVTFGHFDDAVVSRWDRGDFRDWQMQETGNALLDLWASFRDGAIPLREFEAMLLSIQSASWRRAAMVELCGPTTACAPFSNTRGYTVITSNTREHSVPSGALTSPAVMNLRAATASDSFAECAGHDHCFVGRIDSAQTLQFPGSPQVWLQFEGDPAACGRSGRVGCSTRVVDFGFVSEVGGRYRIDRSETCADGYERVRVPWLVPGFLGSASLDVDSGTYAITECRATDLPLVEPGANQSLSMGNSPFDGRPRVRRLELMDGALIDNHQLVLLVSEESESHLSADAPPSRRYGYFVLDRTSVALQPADLVGQPPAVDTPATDRRRPVACDDDLLEALDFSGDELASATLGNRYADRVARGVLDGVNYENPDSRALELVNETSEFVHYYCADDGLFDGVNGGGESIACPSGSPVTFFTLDQDQDWIAEQSCLDRTDADGFADCGATLDSWLANDRHGIRLDPVYVCADAAEVEVVDDRRIATLRNRAVDEAVGVYCDDDRLDLRQGKLFVAPRAGTEVMLPLELAMAEAFQYRIRFASRSASSRVGFVPEVCGSNTESRPYCYDPGAIEEIAQRVECAVSLFNDHRDLLTVAARDELLASLRFHFGREVSVDVFNREIVADGFEHLFAELAIMLGDEHYTRALSSRFDLAGLRMADFAGSQLEPNGMDLTGVPGAEMASLYRALQYYEMVQERFWVLAPEISQSMELARAEGSPGASFISLSTSVSYFSRVVRASTQRAVVYGEIAKRYQTFNRPDLARSVIERAYVAASIDSAAISQLFRELADVLAVDDIAQIEAELVNANRRYLVALTDMRRIHRSITDELTFFGFAPDFMPFPQIERGRDNAFETAMFRAWQRLGQARQAEDQAINSDRSFNTNAASFQNELAQLRTSYDARLAEICGTMEVGGEVYPATIRYAHLSERARSLGDPCGLMGTGAIHDALGQLDVERVNLHRVGVQLRNAFEQVTIEAERIVDQCAELTRVSDIIFNDRGTIADLQLHIGRLNIAKASIDRALSDISNIAFLNTEEMGRGMVAGLAAFVAFHSPVVEGFSAGIIHNEHQIAGLQADLERARLLQGCAVGQVNSEASVKKMILSVPILELDALRAHYGLHQAIAGVDQLRNEAIRTMAEQEELEQLAIDVAAARDNPNVRLYRNDAIRNADFTFTAAVREAYKATRVLEYYTSASYPGLDKLFLTRMVARGDYNLTTYLLGLEDTFRDFEDQYGRADTRLVRLSLRDDLLRLPFNDERGQALSEGERIELLRERLMDGSLLDPDGYLSIPFSTDVTMTSPLTANHKLAWVEVELMGSDLGDPLGRAYLRMAGTASIEAIDGDANYYAFPQRTAVINTFFNGNRVYADAGLYQNRHLKDRPLVNTRWELLLNTVDEEVNEDINLNSLTDIRLYLYYQDFTEF